MNPEQNPRVRASSATPSRRARSDAILRAALEELVSDGYGGLSFERVAARAGVNKTTIYRRYPAKPDLVRAVLEHFAGGAADMIASTGSLRGDLIAWGCELVRLCSSFVGQSLHRILFLERMDPELQKIAQRFDRERERSVTVIAQRAIARGELRSDDDFRDVAEALAGIVMVRVIMKRRLVDELEIARVVDRLLMGVLPAEARK